MKYCMNKKFEYEFKHYPKERAIFKKEIIVYVFIFLIYFLLVLFFGLNEKIGVFLVVVLIGLLLIISYLIFIVLKSKILDAKYFFNNEGLRIKKRNKNSFFLWEEFESYHFMQTLKHGECLNSFIGLKLKPVGRLKKFFLKIVNVYIVIYAEDKHIKNIKKILKEKNVMFNECGSSFKINFYYR